MNKEEYGNIINLHLKDISPIKVEDLDNKTDRTLLYGINTGCTRHLRNLFHVYIKDKKIHVVSYDTCNIAESMVEYNIIRNSDYIKNALLYPETCDYEFCEKLKKFGCQLPFATWNDERPEKRFYGFTLEDKKCCGNCGVTED